MLCVLFLFCSAVLSQADAPPYPGYVAQFAPNVLIAHNTLDGGYFAEIAEGDMLRYYDGKWKDYRVSQVIRAQALTPDSPTSLFLWDGQIYSPPALWGRLYQPDALTLLTCIRRGDLWTWGRLFVIGKRVE